MKTSRILLVGLLAMAIVGCDKTQINTPLQRQDANPQTRFLVERVGMFYDDLAYSDKRGIYLIRDLKTGQEFLGLSGIGISELGSHQSGKTQAMDER